MWFSHAIWYWQVHILLSTYRFILTSGRYGYSSVLVQRRTQEFLKGSVVQLNNFDAIGDDGERPRRELLVVSIGIPPENVFPILPSTTQFPAFLTLEKRLWRRDIKSRVSFSINQKIKNYVIAKGSLPFPAKAIRQLVEPKWSNYLYKIIFLY